MEITSVTAITLLSVLLQLSQGRFDILSALVGAAVAGVIAYVLYRLRERIAATRDGILDRADTVKTRAARGHDARYIEAVARQANTWHVAGHAVALEEVAILPRFIAAPRPYDPLGVDDEGRDSPYAVVPLVLDHAHTVGPYNLPSVDIYHVLRGAPGIALLGSPGSGRSTALALIALLAAQQDSPESEYGILPEIRTPVLFHVGDVDLSSEELIGEIDPAQLMVNAARKRMSGAVARSASDAILPDMADGRCLILADGWDELPEPQRTEALEWLITLMRMYPGNHIVVTGPTRGYSKLVSSGLAPVYLSPWGDQEYNELAQNWAAAWPGMTGTRRNPGEAVDEELVHLVALDNRSRNPLDITLKVWAAYAGDDKEDGRRGWYSAFIDRMLPVEQGREALRRVAVEQYSSEDSGMLGHPGDEVRAYLDAALASAGRMSMETGDFIHEITNKQPLLTERVGGRLAFRHPLVGGFLAAESLAASGRLDTLYDQPDDRLEVIMPFLAANIDVSSLTEERFNAEAEILYDNLTSMANWAADAPADAPWRAELVSRMTQIMLAPSQFPIVRERFLAALIASRDESTISIFQQGLQAEDGLARLLSILGMGALGDPSLVEAIAGGLTDTDIKVQIASTIALGAIGNEDAIGYLVQLLFEGNELVREAAAEAMAAHRDLGHQLLREAVQEEDVVVRRGALYGLARISEPWALDILRELQIEDDQWLVRDAATDTLEKHESGTAQRPPQPFLQPRQMQWLVEWVAEREEAERAEAEERGDGENGVEHEKRGVPGGAEAIELLISVLQHEDGKASNRRAAAAALGKLGSWESINPLYAALRDDSPKVREAAYRALASLSEALGTPLPAAV